VLSKQAQSTVVFLTKRARVERGEKYQNCGGDLSTRDSERVEQGKSKDSEVSRTVQGL